jgi:hypothetical protein
VGETAGDIRHDIEQTRLRMTATMDAIGYKMDIPARMRYRFSHIVQDVNHAFAGKPGNGNGGEPGLPAMGEEKVSSMLHAAHTGLTETKESPVDTMAPIRDATMGGGSIPEGPSITESIRDTGMEATQQVKETARTAWTSVGSFARENPLAVSLGALAAGMVAGLLMPRMRD